VTASSKKDDFKSRLSKRSLIERAEEAMQQAFLKAIDEHARMNVPLQIFENGSIVEISAHDLRKKLNLDPQSDTSASGLTHK